MGNLQKRKKFKKGKKSKKEKFSFFGHALSLMNENLPKEEVKMILEANACCKSGVRERNSKEFSKVNKERSVEERFKLISERPYMNMGKTAYVEENYIIAHGVTYQPNGKYECACPTVSKIKTDSSIAREYCYCCGGHFKYHYEIMLGVYLSLLEIVSSPHDTRGEKSCIFKYEIIECKEK